MSGFVQFRGQGQGVRPLLLDLLAVPFSRLSRQFPRPAAGGKNGAIHGRATRDQKPACRRARMVYRTSDGSSPRRIRD